MKKNSGFTLIEIVIALAIMAIAITAIIKATSQTMRSYYYMQNKMIAAWLGSELMSEIRVNLQPLKSEAVIGEKEMLGQTWFWEALKKATPNPNIDKISLRVFKSQNRESPLIHLETYAYHEKK